MTEYDMLAKYYDLYYVDRKEDIDFWTSISSEVGPSILELSCGTGRLSIPMARVGNTVVGIDVSAEMIKIGKQKIKKLPSPLRKKITMLKADSLSFSLSKRFNAVLCPEAFWAITDKEQDSMLQSVKKHLYAGGYLVMSISNFHERSERIEFQHLKSCRYFPEYGFTMTRQNFVEGNAGSSLDTITHFLDRVYPNGTIKRIVTTRTERQRTKHELKTILTSHGFRIKKVYGGYDKSQWSENSKWTIVVATLSGDTPIESVITKLNNWLY